MFTYLCLYVIFIFVPGFFIAQATGLGRMALRLSLPFSFLFLIANLFCFKLWGISIHYFFVAFVLQLLALILLSGYMTRPAGQEMSRYLRHVGGRVGAAMTGKRQLFTALACLFIPVSLYLIWVGPYTEVPSDFWRHVGKTQQEYLSLLSDGTLPGFLSWRDYGGKDAGYWYDVQALLCFLAGIRVEESFQPQAFVNSVILLVAFFLFTVRILQESEFKQSARYVIASIAVIFFIAHFGTNVFSFVRYYTFGPVVLTYVSYLIFVVTLLDMLSNTTYPKWKHAVVLALLLVLMAATHLQEAMFSVIFGYALVCFIWFRLSIVGDRKLEGFSGGSTSLSKRQADVLFYALSLAVILALALAHFYLKRHDPLAFGRLVNLGSILPFFQNLYVLDPNRQLYETFTSWGYLVAGLFVLTWYRFEKNPVLVCGMLSPLYTVLNPVFTDFFLRVSWPELMWRLLYIAPLPIVGAVLFYICGSLVVKRERPVKVLSGIFVCALLVALLFPINTTFFNSPYSKIYTLAKVPPEDDHRNWADLYEYLGSLDKKRKILSDPVTGYTIRALTKHDHFGAKFSRVWWGGYRNFTFEHYSLDKYEEYDGWLLVVNQRDGGYSKVGDISKHWLGVQRQVHRYYDEGLLKFLQENPEIFRKTWESDRIAVYEIDFMDAPERNS